MRQKVLITGADGQLGNEIASLCSLKNIDFYPANRNSFDITNRQDTVKFIRKYKPTHIIHCAAFTSVDDCEIDVDKAFLVNNTGTANIVEAAEKSKAHITYISTDYVFSGEKDGAYTEYDETGPISVYGISKLLGEHELRPSDASVRISWVNGRHGKNMVKTILRLARDNSELKFVNDQIGCPSFTEDLAPSILMLAKNNAAGPWHLTNQGRVSWYEFAKNVVSLAGLKTEILPITTEELSPPRPARRPKNSVLDNMRLREAGVKELDNYMVPLARLVSELTSS